MKKKLLSLSDAISEGFDDKRLDTLFLTMPISWHGALLNMLEDCTEIMPTKKK